MEELKKCPFCGGEAVVLYGCYIDDTIVKCSKCEVQTHPCYDEAAAKCAWNRRVEG